MPFDPNIHHRRSIRLQGYDYSQPGAYFVTISTAGRECLLGEIANGCMHRNEVGQMVEQRWIDVSRRYLSVETDAYAVMPNHLHGIVTFVGADQRVCPVSLATIVQWFKTVTTNEYIRKVKEGRWPPFRGRLWQRNYYEHVIRHERDLAEIREYISNNPLKWELDEDNPDRWR